MSAAADSLMKAFGFKRVKTKKCKHCRQEFQPQRPLQSACSPECAIYLGRAASARKEKEVARFERLETKARKEKLKSVAQVAKDAERWVNKYVRLRDKDKPCVSCGRSANWDGQWHASHFKSVGANSALRFHLWNIHKACSICNNHLSGNIGEYARLLPGRIGMKRFDFLMSSPREMKYTRDYLVRLKSVAQKACRRLERRQA